MAQPPDYSAEEVDAAVAALSHLERFEHAQDVVTHAAPGLAGVLDQALHAGGYFGEAHDAQVREVAAVGDPAALEGAVRALVEEETRLGMLVGVTVGFELARELAARRDDHDDTGDR
jgi:hypothetical protein